MIKRVKELLKMVEYLKSYGDVEVDDIYIDGLRYLIILNVIDMGDNLGINRYK